MKKKIILGVNIDHAATLRQVRGGTTSYPDLVSLAKIAVKAGASQITVHLREDRRHIQEHDLKLLCDNRFTKINLEMAATAPMLRKALTYKPDWVCFVPEKRQELTTEGGLDLIKKKLVLKKMTSKLQRIGIEVSFFIEPSLEQIRTAYEIGADAIELHTGKFVQLKGQAKNTEWKKLVNSAELAHELGLRVHAGHGLDYVETAIIKKLPHLVEVNIGHSIICYSLELGMEKVIKKFKKILK